MSKKVVSVYELTPVDGRKSFYKKAHVLLLEDGTKLLQSYSTIVAAILSDGTFCKLWDDWSATTARHLSAFTGQYKGKKAWDAMPYDYENVKTFCDIRVDAHYTASDNWNFGYNRNIW